MQLAFLNVKPGGQRGWCQTVKDTIHDRTEFVIPVIERISSHYQINTLHCDEFLDAPRFRFSNETPRLQAAPPHFLAITTLSKKLRGEALHLLFSQATFDFGEDWDAVPVFCKQIGSRAASKIQSIRLEHVEHSEERGSKGIFPYFFPRAKSIDISVQGLLPCLKTLYIALWPWQYYHMEDELPPWGTSVSKLLVKLSSFSGDVFLSLRSDYDPAYVSGP